MKIIQVEQKTPEWLELRKGKVTGTVLKRIVGTPKAQESAFWDLLAERLTVSDGYENEAPMDRGVRLEQEARETFEKKTGKRVEVVGFVLSDFSKEVGYSPDGMIRKGKRWPEDIEVKCLSSGNHVRAWRTGKIPPDYMDQVIHGFMVNDELETRHVVFFDPRITVKPYFVIKVERGDVAEQIELCKGSVKDFLKKLDQELSAIVKI